MAYRRDLAIAARRHLRAAQLLAGSEAAGARPGCLAVAGYLFGLAGELALKEMMRRSGMRELPEEERSHDPFYAHFPQLKTSLARSVSGRRGNELRRIVEDPRLFQNWDVRMRYAPTEDIHEQWVLSWKSDAEGIVDRMAIS